jgi:hypothetical protein
MSDSRNNGQFFFKCFAAGGWGGIENAKVQFFQTSLLNLGTLGWEIFYWLVIDSDLCDLRFFADGALFCSLEE